jgi:hypothetical protein
MSDVIRELGVLVYRAQREKIDAFVEANRAEIISAAWDMSEVLCKWRTLSEVFYLAQPRDKYGRVTVQPMPESEIRVFHAANGKKIVAEVDRLKSLDPNTVTGLYAALELVVRDAINNKEQEGA